MAALVQAAGSVTVDDHGLTLPASVGGVVTVAFDGRYVWSFQPRRDARPGASGPVVPWPVSLRPHLNGRTRLTLAEPGTDRTYLDREVVLGRSPEERIRLEDGHGHPLAVNKVGNLTRVFAETDDASRAEILRGTARVLDDLRECGGVEAFLNYGCLLGAVREGRMIGTDCDADVCYLSEQTHPADVIRESYALERAMLTAGWPTVRMSGGDFKVLLRLTDGRTCYVDVFVAFYCEGVFYQLGNRSGHLPREAVVPTSTILLEGVELPGPADPEAMLAFVYGPSWRVPDPSFRFTDPPGGVRRLDGWLRGYRDDLPAWNELFRGPRGDDVPPRPSDFARWVRRRVRPGDTIVEIGSGTGRDAAFFARRGHPVRAYDVSPEARTRTQRRLRRSDPTLRRGPADAGGAPHGRGHRGRGGDDRRVGATSTPGEWSTAWTGRGGATSGGWPAWRCWAPTADCSWSSPRPATTRPCPSSPRAWPVGWTPTALWPRSRRTAAASTAVSTGPARTSSSSPTRPPAGCRSPSRAQERPPMSDLRGAAVRARATALRVRAARAAGVRARLRDLEAEVQESRRLNRRVAELTDLVAELVVPLARRDDADVQAVLERYRSII